MSEIMIKAKNLSFKYENEAYFSIQDVNFEIGRGEIILLTGNSGSGKSTLIKCLNGLIPNLVEGSLVGEVWICDKNTATSSMADININIGSLFQNPRSQFFTTNTTAELVFPMENFGYKKDLMEENKNKLCREFRIDGLLDRDIFKLSSGERQLLALASSKSLNQKIMILDEPSANLDYCQTKHLSDLIRQFKDRGITVIIADHRFYYLKNLIDRVFLMDDGKLNIYDSEEAFKASDYATRGFDLFNLDIAFNENIKTDEVVAEINNVDFKDVLKNINLKLYNNEVAVLIGNNGVGKTTLAKLLIGSYKVDSGEIIIKDLPFYVMQDADYQLFGHSLANELSITDNSLSDKDIDDILTVMGIDEFKDKHPFDLSGGQKQRLQIALATVANKSLIIFDEPTSGLDVISMKRVVEQIKKLAHKAGILIISHDYEFIRSAANRVIYLKNQNIVDDFTLNEENIDKFNRIFKEMEVKE